MGEAPLTLALRSTETVPPMYEATGGSQTELHVLGIIFHMFLTGHNAVKSSCVCRQTADFTKS